MCGKRQMMAVAMTVVLMGATVAPAWAGALGDDGAGQGFFGAGRPLANCLKECVAKLKSLRGKLNLTAEQKKEIVQILKDNRGDIVKAIQQVHAKRRTMLNAVRADSVNEGAIRRAANDFGKAMGDANVLRARIRHEIRSALTPDQRGRVDDVIADIEQTVDDTVSNLGQ